MGRSYRSLRKNKPLILQNKRSLRKHKKVSQDSNVHKAWDTMKTNRANYETIGLILDPNHPEITKPVEVPSNVIPEFHEFVSSKGKYYMKPEDRLYISKLLNKYKDNFYKMFMDIKLNYKQLTQRKLEKMAEHYQKYLVEHETLMKLNEEKKKQKQLKKEQEHLEEEQKSNDESD